MNISLSPEEVHQRKKQLLIEMEKNKSEVAPVDDVGPIRLHFIMENEYH